MPTELGRLQLSLYQELVDEFRQLAMQNVDVVELLSFLCRELGGEMINLDNSVQIGPDKTESGMRLAIVAYLDRAFGLLHIDSALSTLSGALWSISADGNSLIESYPGALDPIAEMIEQNRKKWDERSS